MNYNPDTYEITIPFYSEYHILSDEIKPKVLKGEIIIPPEHTLDSKEYLRTLARNEANKRNEEYYKAKGKAHNAFLTDMEEKHDFKYMPQHIKNKIHGIAWEKGHLGGYNDVDLQYNDLVTLAKLVHKSCAYIMRNKYKYNYSLIE